MAREARSAVTAGARALHFHVRGGDGKESLVATDVAATLDSVRATCHGVPAGVSTGAWIIADPAVRLDHIRRWSVLPDYVSVNVHEPGSLELIAHLLERGVGVEAGLWHVGGARLLVESGLGGRCLRLLLEPMESNVGEALANVDAIEKELTGAGLAIPRLLHGKAETTWPLIARAGSAKWATRIGLEDSQHLPDGSVARDNAELVTAARRLLASLPA
jgi:uncharacterized protein (DUF849 family)